MDLNACSQIRVKLLEAQDLSLQISACDNKTRKEEILYDFNGCEHVYMFVSYAYRILGILEMFAQMLIWVQVYACAGVHPSTCHPVQMPKWAERYIRLT